MDKENTSIIVALDVETVPSRDTFEFEYLDPVPTISDVPEHGSLKDAYKIKAWKDEKLKSMVLDWTKDAQKAYDKAYEDFRSEALCSYKGRIMCMSYAKNTNWKNIKTIDFVGGEKEMLQEFYNDIKQYSVVGFMGTNLKFDLMFLFHRALHFGLFDLANKIRCDRGYTKNRDIELMELAGGGLEFKYRISLDNICKLLGVKSPKEGIDGSKVFDYYLQGKIEEIKQYNKADVSQLIECYQILK